jgi:hypothetical protein
MLELEDASDSGDVDSRVGQGGNLAEPFDVVSAVEAGTAGAAIGFDQALSLVHPQGLWMQAAQLSRHGDGEDSSMTVRPLHRYHPRSRR